MSFPLREYLAADREANRGNPKGLFLVRNFRIANWIRSGNRLRRTLGTPFLIYYKLFVEWILSFELPCSTSVGPGLKIHHGSGVVINPKSKIGAGCCLLHHVTIGTVGDGPNAETPVIEDNVIIGAGSMILGPVHVGEGARIGAATLVLKDVPAGAVVVGNPMRVLKDASDDRKIESHEDKPVVE